MEIAVRDPFGKDFVYKFMSGTILVRISFRNLKLGSIREGFHIEINAWATFGKDFRANRG